MYEESKILCWTLFLDGGHQRSRISFFDRPKNEHFQIMPKTCMKMIIASNSPLITICGMWSQFLDSGVVIFLHLKMATFGDFGCKKMGLRTPEYKNGDHFLSLFVKITQICYLPILFATSLGYVSRDVSTKI